MGESGFSKVGVVGFGQMGSGIAQVLAQHGFEVTVVDVSEERLEKGMEAVKKSLDRLVRRYEKTEGKQGVSPELRDEALARIAASTEVKALAGMDLVIEAIVENFQAKADLYHALSDAGFGGYLASNTSSISITKLGAETHDPTRFMGMHFMNPVPIQPGVELIRGFLTSDETAERILALALELEKVPIQAEDKAGFMVNRIWIPFVNEAVRVVEEGLCSVEDVDKVTYCLAHKMGPLMTADYVGLDTVLAICEVLQAELGDAYRPAPLLRRLVESGQLGLKSGVGFYLWEEGKATKVNPAVARYRNK